MEEWHSKYPFLPESQEIVREAGFDINRLINSPAYESERKWAVKRIKSAIKNKDQKNTSHHAELLSYPISRLIASCINDHYLTRKIALHESKKFHSRIEREDRDKIQKISEGLGIQTTSHLTQNQTKYSLHWTDYLKHTKNIKDKKWKLINREIENGEVKLNKKQFNRVLQEAIRNKILRELPLDVPEKICSQLEKYSNEIKKTLEEKKNKLSIDTDLPIKQTYYPPCIKNLISRSNKGENLSHTERFTLVSFLINIGMNIQEVLDVFRASPDYDEEKTKYQVEHIGGRDTKDEYTPPSCRTMKTYNICPEPEGMCKKISHPLNYYRWKAKKNNKKDKPNENKDN
ncbi:DNA primase large subunit PriL [Methanonatronarchaeum sp. AMET6-2]|uniref:DNA primase large subunit PriL n=1 Tax=Methanonatronarchaeum sp. AMET6-2 TaxID=2933293 RepID=UPI001227E63D|nr:DNA primase large subunit PriL [Methanonatronarchaeum sp. AMET6-2]RZN62598.1 MAG: DNA primase regulatory subunit PriL [Methanonatronarchaeia archaeon]UOY09408.1 DNA primase large subunit PriL [Methanonatronarchaeum sp. AMET6-2]